jgi:hypothetical protein
MFIDQALIEILLLLYQLIILFSSQIVIYFQIVIYYATLYKCHDKYFLKQAH